MKAAIKKATVLGGGAFGTAMAQCIARNGVNVSMWVRETEVVDDINKFHVNKLFLPKITLADTLTATNDLKESLVGTELVLLVIPTQFLRRVMVQERGTLPVGVPIVCCSKGIENDTLQTPYEILIEELPGKYHPWMCALSGPSFAEEAAAGMPTNVLCAGATIEVAEKVQTAMSDSRLRIYTGTDIIGAEICGAVKNVIAIACGGAAGFGFGRNTAALVMTRGLLEMSRLAMEKGANPSTMMGLAGMGDLVLTCTSEQSRNFTTGKRIASGESLKDIVSSKQSVAEGVATSISIYHLAQKLKVDMPICTEVYKVLHEGKPFLEAMISLQNRPLKQEFSDTDMKIATKSIIKGVGGHALQSKM